MLLRTLFLISLFLLISSALRAEVLVSKVIVEPVEQEKLVTSVLPFRVGDVFDKKLAEIAKRLLSATEKFEDVDVAWDGAQAVLKITVRPKLYFDEILWEHPVPGKFDGVRHNCVLSYEPRNIGEERISQIKDCILRQTRGRGYLDAEVDILAKDVQLTIDLRLGSLYTIQSIDFSDNEKLTDAELLESIQNKKGRFFEASKLEDDTKSILKRYFDEGFYFAEVFKPALKVDPEKKVVSITWKIKESYPMDIQFTGHRKSRALLNQYLDREQSFPAWFVDEMVDELSNDLKEEGYLAAEIKVSKTLTEHGIELIDIHTRRGPAYKLVAPDWVGVGNKKEISKIYESVSQLSDGSVFEEAKFRSAVTDEFVPMLMARGYLDARVRNLDFVIDREKARVKPVIYLNEGEVYFVRSAAIVGTPPGFETIQEVKDLMAALEVSKPFNAVNVDRLQTELQRHLVRAGFLDAVIERKFTSTSLGVEILINLSPGVRYRVGKILIKGAVKTDYDILRREVLLSPGDYYEDEKVKDSISHIFRLGLARSVDIQILEKDPNRAEVYAMVDVVEAARFRFEVGPGYGTLDGLRGVFKATYANIGGTARRLTLYSKASRRFASAQSPNPLLYANAEEIPFIQRRLSLEYFEPSIFSLSIDGRLNYTHAKEEKNRLGQENSFTASIDYRWSRHWLFTSNYELSFSDPFNVLRENMKEGDDKSKRFTNVGEVVVIDYLNDSFNPLYGSRTRLEGNLFNEHLGGEVNFWQTLVRQEFFAPFWVMQKGKSIGLALNIGSGFSEHYGTSHEVPLEKRSQIGGESSVRGYALGSIDPQKDGKTQVGGNSYFYFQTELNLPVAYGVDLLGFFDAGNSYFTNGDFKVWDLRYGAGPGLRWNTPVGPLKVGYGFKLFRKPGESLGSLYIGVGAI